MEKQISVTCVAAIVLWVATVVFIFGGTVVGLVMGHEQMPVVVSLMAHGLVLSAGAATLTIRYMLREQNQMMRDVFALGRDSAGASVRRLP